MPYYDEINDFNWILHVSPNPVDRLIIVFHDLAVLYLSLCGISLMAGGESLGVDTNILFILFLNPKNWPYSMVKE